LYFIKDALCQNLFEINAVGFGAVLRHSASNMA